MTKKWYNNGKIEIQLLERNEVPDGFKKGRLRKPSKVDELSKQISKELLFDLYIIQNKPFDKVFEELNISRRDLRLLLTFYDISKDHRSRALNNKYKRPKDVIQKVAEKSSAT